MNGILRLLFTLYILENWQPGADFVTYAQNSRRGCTVSCSSARIGISPHISDEQSDADIVSYGALAYANSSRVAVATN
jgi:hypothetical protein